jgi:hypothetical protein
LVHNGGIAEKGFTVPDSKRDQATVGKSYSWKASKLQLEKHRSISGNPICSSENRCSEHIWLYSVIRDSEDIDKIKCFDSLLLEDRDKINCFDSLILFLINQV